MKSLVLGGGRAWLEETPQPAAEPGWAVVRAMALPVCGSDMGTFRSPGENRWAGHEGTGIVEDVAAGSRLKPGDRVVIAPQATCGECALCRAGDYIYCRRRPDFMNHFHQFVKKQDALLPRLPDDISLEAGSLAGCALCPGFSALDLARVGAFDKVLVTGLGPVGLGTVASASFRGARVLAVEPEPFRRALAMELGAEGVFDPAAGEALEWVRERTAGLGASCAVECSGRSEAARLCIDAAATLGRVAIVGENHGRVEIGPSDDFIRKGLTLFGTWFGSYLNYPRVFDLIRRKPAVAKIITHTFPFASAQQAFETFQSGKAGKVVLLPWG
jgi:L-iditol 2-dehydrogenase